MTTTSRTRFGQKTEFTAARHCLGLDLLSSVLSQTEFCGFRSSLGHVHEYLYRREDGGVSNSCGFRHLGLASARDDQVESRESIQANGYSRLWILHLCWIKIRSRAFSSVSSIGIVRVWFWNRFPKDLCSMTLDRMLNHLKLEDECLKYAW